MPILAAPLVIPFAEAVGISIATLGMAKGADMVNDYIQENPEESAMILKTLVPNLGIGQIFMNKEKISLEDLEEMTDEEAQDLSKEDKAELMKQGGKSRSKDKRQTMIDLSEKLGLSGEGREQQDIEYEVDERYDEGGVEDAPKPKFDYKKFFRNKRADGGAIGIEVLFEPKRKDFNIGGNVQRVTTPQPYDARASAADFARAIDKVGAGTDLQKAVAIGEYGQNVQRQNPFKNLGFFDTQRHFDNNQLLKNAVTRGELSPADYNRLGGYDVTQTMGAGNPVVGGIGNLLGSTGYNAYQSIKDGQPILEGIKDIARNVQGGTGLISDDLKAQYESIINPTVDQDRISEIVEQQKAAGVPDEGLITNFNRPTMADVAGPIQDSKRENLYLKDIGIDGINDESPLNILQKYLDLNKNIKDNTVLQDYAEGARSGYLSDYIDPYAEGFNLEKDYFNNPNNLRRLAIDYDPRSGKLAYYDKNEGPYGAYKYYSGDLVDQDFVSSYGLKRFDPKDLSNFATPQAYGPALADGGRVGLFMGGDPLTGQALSIYESMNAYGFSDQEIANALEGQGLYTPGSTPVVEEPVTNTVQNIINQGGGDGPPNDPPKDPYGGLGYSSANFGLGKGINKDAVMDYEADAYEQGRTFTGQLNKIGLGIFSALKNIPTPFNLVRMGIQKAKDIARQKEIEKEMQQAAIARDIARSNKAAGTGGYQAGYDSDFMDGPSGAGTGMGAADKGGSDSMGSFKRGGLATMFVEKR